MNIDIDGLKDKGLVGDEAVGYETILNVSAFGVVFTEDGSSAGLLVEPMDRAPLVIGLGAPEEVKALGKYLLEVADHLE